MKIIGIIYGVLIVLFVLILIQFFNTRGFTNLISLFLLWNTIITFGLWMRCIVKDVLEERKKINLKHFDKFIKKEK